MNLYEELKRELEGSVEREREPDEKERRKGF
jgi:hypothetical protein